MGGFLNERIEKYVQHTHITTRPIHVKPPVHSRASDLKRRYVKAAWQKKRGMKIFRWTLLSLARCVLARRRGVRRALRGIRTRNRQNAYILAPRPLPPPSMLVLAGHNKKWALSVLFCM